MAAFSRAAYTAAAYTSARPAYPQALYDTIMAYHCASPIRTPKEDPQEVLLDVGTGTGTVARALAPYFHRVVAVDPSERMLDVARKESEHVKTLGGNRIEFFQSKAEDIASGIPGVEKECVTCLVSGQAAHWFDRKLFFRAAKLVLARGGTLALWGYKDPIVVGRPEVNVIYHDWTYERKDDGMGRFWEQPGRRNLLDLVRNLNFVPSGPFSRRLWRFYIPDRQTWTLDEAVGGPKGKLLPTLPLAWLRKTTTLGEFETYLRSYSAFSNWREHKRTQSPELAKSRAEGNPDGDLVDWMMDDMLDAVPEWKEMGPVASNAPVELVWATYLHLATKRRKKSEAKRERKGDQQGEFESPGLSGSGSGSEFESGSEAGPESGPESDPESGAGSGPGPTA